MKLCCQSECIGRRWLKIAMNPLVRFYIWFSPSWLLVFWLLRAYFGGLLFSTIHCFLGVELAVFTFWRNANEKIHVWMMLTWLSYYHGLLAAGWARLAYCFWYTRPLVYGFKAWVQFQNKWMLWIGTNFRPC